MRPFPSRIILTHSNHSLLSHPRLRLNVCREHHCHSRPQTARAAGVTLTVTQPSVNGGLKSHFIRQQLRVPARQSPQLQISKSYYQYYGRKKLSNANRSRLQEIEQEDRMMTPLTQKSREAIERLKNYQPPMNQWEDIDVSRRAGVLILLFPDAKGDLRVVLTERSATLRSFAGQVALPGGKADDATESAFTTARREASEEIGLPEFNEFLPPPFTVTHLCEMPMNVSRNQLGVRPCVALLHTTNKRPGPTSQLSDSGGGVAKTPNPEESLIPRLDPKEVASVFTVPFEAFLTAEYKNPELSKEDIDEIATSTDVDVDFGTVANGDSGWYEGQWLEWYGIKWRAHQFNVYTSPVVVQKRDWNEKMEEAAEAKGRGGGGTHDKKLVKYKVWGMTARIVVDAARVAYGKNPDFEFADKMGDDEVIGILMKEGKMGPKARTGGDGSGHGERGDGHAKGKEAGKL